MKNDNPQIDHNISHLPGIAETEITNANANVAGAGEAARFQDEYRDQVPSLNSTTSVNIDQDANIKEARTRDSSLLKQSLSDQAHLEINNDPTGMYKEALNEEFGIRSAPTKKPNPLRARALDMDMREHDENRRGHREADAIGGMGRNILGHLQPSISGYEGGKGSRQSQGVGARSKGHYNLVGDQSVNLRSFEDPCRGSGNSSAMQEYQDSEMMDDSQSPQREMGANVSSSFTMAPPPAFRNIPNSQPSHGPRSLDFLPSSLSLADEDQDDDSELFVQRNTLRGSGGSIRGVGSSVKRGAKASHGRGSASRVPKLVDRTPVSLRAGKRQFSTIDFGQLDEDDLDFQHKAPRISSNHVGPRKSGNSTPHNPDAYVKFLAERSQHPHLPTPQSYQPNQPFQYKNVGEIVDADEMEEDEDMEEIEEEFSSDSRAGQNVQRPKFNNIGRELRDSRYAGGVENVNVNQDPPMVPQEEVSNAALEKRNLKRGKKDTVCPRGYGANDPENIEIVNLRESENMTFDQIAKFLNKKRIESGKAPTLSTTGVTSRYNRTAPLLFAAQGEEFVPLSQRKRSTGNGKTAFNMVWTDKLDTLLVKITKEVEMEKWVRVAEKFTIATGKQMTPTAVAYRYNAL